MDDQQPAGEGAEDARVTTVYQEPDVVLYLNSSDNDDILRRLSANDPAIAGLKLQINDGFEQGHNFEEERFDRVGFAIGNSAFLRKLEVSIHIRDETAHDISPLFSRIAENRSVEHFALNEFRFRRQGMDIISILTPFFEMNHNLRCLSIRDSEISTSMPIIISSLLQSKSNQLERIDFLASDIDDEHGADLINALIANFERHRLVDLCLAWNPIGTTCCVAIGELLTHPACKLQTLDLGGNENFDDECMATLLNSLAKNNTIKDLHLNSESNVTPSGWTNLPDVFSNPFCSVEAIDIGQNVFDDHITWQLGHALCSNKSLKVLDVPESFGVGPDGWRRLTECLNLPKFCALPAILN